MNIHVKPIFIAMKDGIAFLAIIKKEKNLKNVAAVVCTPEGIIKDLTASSISLLGLEKSCLNMQQINIQNLVIYKIE